MDRIILADHIDDLPDVRGRAVAITSAGRLAPRGIDTVTVDDILERPEHWFDGNPLTMVIVGLSSLMTPSNRVRVGQVLLRPRPGVRRISIDDRLFNVEPWRMWWHFYAVGEERWGFTDSFLAETRWKSALEFRTPCPFSLDSAVDACRGVVRAVRPFTFPRIDVDVIETDAETKALYQVEKEAAFASEKTLAAILKRLSAFADAVATSRSVPTPAGFFKSPPSHIIRTDLAVDVFLVNQLLERAAITNTIAERCS